MPRNPDVTFAPAHRRVFLALAALAAAPLTLAQQPLYYHRVLPSTPSNGDGTRVTDINNRGQIVGRSGWTGLTERRESPFSVEWNGDLQNLDTLGFDLHDTVLANDAGASAGIGLWWTSSNGNTTCGASTIWRRPADGEMLRPGPIFRTPRLIALNERGDLLIESDPRVPHDFTTPGPTRQSYVIDAAGRTFGLDTLGGLETLAADMNNDGQVVGASGTGELDGQNRPLARAFLWQDGTMLDLGTLGGPGSAARRINDAGLVVGLSDTADGRQQLFTWTSAAGMQPLPLPLAFDFVDVAALSETGWIAGTFSRFEPDERSGAFVIAPDGAFHEITPFTPTAVFTVSAVNADGAVVGSAFDFPTFESRAWHWTAAGGLRDLREALVDGPLAFPLHTAIDINDAGQIIATGGDFVTLSVALWPRRPGDLNCDTVIDFFDVDGFLLALFDRDAYAAAFPACALRNADANGDAAVDFGDIDAFVALLFD